MESMNYKDLNFVVEQIRALVPCLDMQNVLFDCKDGVKENSLSGNLNLYMRNIITMSFVLTYTRWKQVYNNETDELKNNDEISKLKSARYSTIFESIDRDENLNLDIMVFALIEVWVSTRGNDYITNRIFDKFFSKDKPDIGVVLQKALKFAHSEELDTIEASEQNKLICEVLESMEIFCWLEMKNREEREDFFDCRYKRSAIRYVELRPNKGCDVRFVCLKGYFDYAEHKCEEEVIPKRLRPYIRYGYSKLSDEITYDYHTFDEQYYKEITLPYTNDFYAYNVEKQKVDAMHQLMAFNYKRLRDFTLVVSDAINGNDKYKEDIFNLYKDKYKTVFPDGILPKEDYMWDNIITLLFVELGPTEFLQSFIDSSLYNKILYNIKVRYITDEQRYDEITKKYNESLKALEKACTYQNRFKTISRKRLMASTIVNAMHNSDGKIVKDIDFAIYEESLATKYDKAKLLIDTLKGDIGIKEFEDARKELESTLSGMLRLMQMFYAGIIGYAEKGQQGFIEAAREKKNEIQGLGLSGLYDSFVSQCETVSTKDTLGTLSDDARSLKKMITRTYICDIKKLKYFTSVDIDGEKLNIFVVLEQLNKYAGREQFKEILNKILGFFIYLVYNDDCDSSHMESDDLINMFENGRISEKEIDPIYPYIVSYFSENTDRDEVKRCNYRAYFPAKYSEGSNGDDMITVTLLTERDYTKNTNYYCLPLKYGSTGKWWIEPFMIPTEVFKQILKEEDK